MTPPAQSWIRFLRNYGPIPTNGNLFDEHVSAALTSARIEPITLPAPYVEAMVDFILAGEPGSVLVAGTAGDGKTYHCRQLWTMLGGDPMAWAARATVKTLELKDGRSIVFVKDLSELKDDQGSAVLAGLERSILNGDVTSTFVIACNHGQILDRLRKHKDQDGNPSALYAVVQDAFLLAGFTHERLKVFDLSRTGHRQALDDVLRAVTEHPEWGKCSGCALNQDVRKCPIAVNRDHAMGAGDEGRFRSRLADLIEIATLNGEHLPVRDLLALVANMLLGHPEAKEGVLSCGDVARIQADRTTEKASLYRNVFGENLPGRRAMDRAVFRTLASFGIGEETTNGIDGLLVYGSDDARFLEDFAKYIANDQVYGATPQYLALQRQYLEGGEIERPDDDADPFLVRLRDQRQRLFFTLPTEAGSRYPYWGLTAFNFADEYLRMLEAVSPETRRSVEERTRTSIVQGLNRVLTGLLIDNDDEVFIASSGGFTQSKISVLCDKTVPSKRSSSSGIGMTIRLDKNSQRPCLDISVGSGAADSEMFELTPVRFEFLWRVAEGALPSSFSNECFEDLLAFKARLLRRVEVIRSSSRSIQNDEPEWSDEDEAGLGLTFIEVEQQGHAFLKRISIRSAK